MKRKTQSKYRSGENLHITNQKIICPSGGSLMKHDNGKCPVSKGGAQDLYVRVPSIKRSTKVWRNFYHLFPWVYFKMKELADKRGIKPGSIMTMDWPTRAKIGQSIWYVPYERMVKVRVMDLSGEFTQILPILANRYPWTIDSTILDGDNCQKNKHFITRNAKLFTKTL